jgi:hypothetical protein
MSDIAAASITPRRAATPAEAREFLDADGAAIIGDVTTDAAVMEVATAVLADKIVRLGRQFETSKEIDVEEAARIAALPVDSRGRQPYFYGPAERMLPHNDGFLFADFTPDYMFLWCERPALPSGGESFLVDGAALVRLLREDPATAELGRFCQEVDIDHSDPSAPQLDEAPIARRLPNGRVQVRNHHNITAKAGPAEAADAATVRRWQKAVCDARDRGPMFRMQAGDLICIDNYRMLHGRDSFDDPGRLVHAYWAWTKEAIAIPREALDLAKPAVPSAL